MSLSRDIAEARVIFGRQTVDEAIADPIAVAREVSRSPHRMLEAVRDLRGMLPGRPQEATIYASGLPHGLRLAIAGLWCGDLSARRLMLSEGLDQGGNDAEGW